MADLTMQQTAVAQMLSLLPDRAQVFEDSEYPAPVRATFLGAGDLSIPALRAELLARQAGDVKDLLRPLLLAAELVEAAQERQSAVLHHRPRRAVARLHRQQVARRLGSGPGRRRSGAI